MFPSEHSRKYGNVLKSYIPGDFRTVVFCLLASILRALHARRKTMRRAASGDAVLRLSNCTFDFHAHYTTSLSATTVRIFYFVFFLAHNSPKFFE